MNASELAQKMLEWEALAGQLKALESEIENAVLEIGKTQTVGNVRATYSEGRRSFDYETAWAEFGYMSGLDIEEYKKVSYDYRAACKDAGVVDENIPVLKQSPPSVTVKLI